MEKVEIEEIYTDEYLEFLNTVILDELKESQDSLK